MTLRWPFGAGERTWTAVDMDMAREGRMLGTTVTAPRGATDKPRVLKCAQSTPVAMGVHALQELSDQLGKPASWTLPLARGDYQMLVLPEPPVPEAEMEASLRWALTPMVEYPVEMASVAWMRIPTAELQPEQEKQVYAIVARQATLDEQAAPFNEAKLPLKAVDVRETALRNIGALLEKKGEGLGMLSFGPTGVTSTFTFKGELYLDRFIAQPLDELVAMDEQRQQKFFERVAQQVYQSMELITRSHSFISIERIVIAPTPVPLAVARYLAGKLPVPVEQLDLAKVFDLSAVPELSKPENQARYLIALGAALRGQKASK